MISRVKHRENKQLAPKVTFEGLANRRLVWVRSDGRHVPTGYHLTHLSNVILRQQGTRTGT